MITLQKPSETGTSKAIKAVDKALINASFKELLLSEKVTNDLLDIRLILTECTNNG